VTVTDSAVQNNSQAGISASSSNATIDRTFVLENAGGGIRLSQSVFTVFNTVVANNGLTTSASAFGGVRIVEPDAPALFLHNTVVGNGLSGKSGIDCAAGSASIVNSLVWANGDPASASDEVVNCGQTHAGSHIDGNASAQQCGASALPDFTENHHLLPTSPCKDKVPCDPRVQTDIDGDERPQPAGGLCDVGADEAR
jgi:hypothetical protein